MKEFRRGDIVVLWGSPQKRVVTKFLDGVLYLEYMDASGTLYRGTASIRRVANHFITSVCSFCDHSIGDHAIGPCEKCLCPRYQEKEM